MDVDYILICKQKIIKKWANEIKRRGNKRQSIEQKLSNREETNTEDEWSMIKIHHHGNDGTNFRSKDKK